MNNVEHGIITKKELNEIIDSLPDNIQIFCEVNVTSVQPIDISKHMIEKTINMSFNKVDIIGTSNEAIEHTFLEFLNENGK